MFRTLFIASLFLCSVVTSAFAGPAARSTAIGGIWGSAGVPLVGNPSPGATYVKPTLSGAAIAAGWQHGRIVSSADSNEYFKRVSGVVTAADQWGILPWNSTTTYQTGALALGTDGKVYQLTAVSSLNQNPISTPSAWIHYLAQATAIIVSNVEPTPIRTGMLWEDTRYSPPILRAGNSTANGWLIMGTMADSGFIPYNSQTVPAGAITAFAMNTPPAGYLVCDGRAVSRVTYAALFSAIGTTYGVGDGSTTFKLPDLRGEFLRGWDGQGSTARGTLDSGRIFGSSQLDQLQQILGTFGADDQTASQLSGVFSQGAGFNYDADSHGGSGYKVVFDASKVARTGAETRPRNVAIMYAIKY